MKTNSLPKILVALFATCLLSYVFVACKDVKTTPLQEQATQQTKEITVENGRLKFVDMTHFKATLKYLESNQTTKVLDEWESKFSDFVSARTAFSKITKDDMVKIATSKDLSYYDGFLTLIEDYDGEDKIAKRQISGDAISTLFNKEGLVLIGKDAHRYTLDKAIKFTNYKESDFVAFQNGVKLPNITTSPIVKQKIFLKNGRSISNSEHCTKYVGSGKRFAADYNLNKCDGSGCLFDENEFYRFSTTVQYQDRFMGIWWNANAAEIRREGLVNGWFSLNSGQQYNSGWINTEETTPANNRYIGSIWVKVAGKVNSSSSEETCTCSN